MDRRSNASKLVLFIAGEAANRKFDRLPIASFQSTNTAAFRCKSSSTTCGAQPLFRKRLDERV